MIKFFRKIRQRLLTENRFSKYLIYAIGEIILVVIGILLALQINNWNIKSINTDKEKSYLLEIKDNLETDIVKIDSILKFNDTKKQSVLNVFKGFEMSEGPNDAQIVDQNLYILGQYDMFHPKDLGFQNLISAENIGLIKNNELRKALLNYYNFDFKDGTQERMEEVTRNMANYVVPIISTKERFSLMYNVDLNVPSNNDVDLATDQTFLSLVHLMDIVGDFQTALLKDTKNDIEQLIKDINVYLSKS